MWTLLVIPAEPERERAHQSDKLLRLQIRLLGESIDNQTASVRLWTVLDDVSLRADVLSAHIENHGRSTAVLHGGVASQLNQIGRAKHRRDVIARVCDLFDLLDRKAKLFALRNGKLILQRDSTRRTPKSIIYSSKSASRSTSQRLKALRQANWLIHTYLALPFGPIKVASYMAARIMAGMQGVL